MTMELTLILILTTIPYPEMPTPKPLTPQKLHLQKIKEDFITENLIKASLILSNNSFITSLKTYPRCLNRNIMNDFDRKQTCNLEKML